MDGPADAGPESNDLDATEGGAWSDGEAAAREGCAGLNEILSVSFDGVSSTDSWVITDNSTSYTASVSLRIESEQTLRPNGNPFLIVLSVSTDEEGPQSIPADADTIALAWNNERCNGEMFQGSVEISHADGPGADERRVCGTFDLECTDPDSGATIDIQGTIDSTSTVPDAVVGGR